MQAVELGRRRAHDRALDLPRALRQDQLPGDRAQERLRDGAGAHRPQPANPLHRLAEQRIVREPRQELAVVVVEPEGEADVLDAALALRRDDDRPVGALGRVHPLQPAVDPNRRAVLPSATTRQASPASRPETRSEYGPFGLSSARSIGTETRGRLRRC